MGDAAVKLSVIIPTYERSKLLSECLNGFSRQTLPRDDFEVLVIDDGSADDTRSMLNQTRFPFTVRPFFQSHGGAARARNAGIREAAGEIVVFTDDDCIPNPNFLDMHLNCHLKEKGIVARGPVVIVRSVNEISETRPGTRDRSMNFFCTSNASLRKVDLMKAGTFDETFGRWEDAELGYRLRKAGLEMRFMTGAAVFHLKPPWKLEHLIRTAKADGQGAVKLFRAHPSLRTWMSGGLHPMSRLAGKALKPIVARKISQMSPDSTVDGIWERLIFHTHFIEGQDL